MTRWIAVVGVAFALAAALTLSAKRPASKPAAVAELVIEDGPALAKGDRAPLPAQVEPLPKLVATERIEPANPTPARIDVLETARTTVSVRRRADADPVCGPRGRTWYAKENGWRYWRCVR